MRVESAEEKKPSSAEFCFCAGILAGATVRGDPNFRVAQEMIDEVVVWLLDMAEEKG